MSDNTFSPGPTPDTVKSAGDYGIVQEKKRLEVRRMLARHPKELLSQYRRGESASVDCPLQRALAGPATGGESK
jgi:hypothetical protein